VPLLLGAAIDQFIKVVEHTAVMLRATVLDLIRTEEETLNKSAGRKSETFSLGDKLNTAVLGTGRA
jgi:hypothetical protein